MVPADVTAAFERAIRLFEDMQAALIDEQAEILMLPADQRARLTMRSVQVREMIAAIEGQLEALRDDFAIWLRTDLTTVYQVGAAASLGERFAWTPPHTRAIRALASAMWDDVLAATDFVSSDVRRWVRHTAQNAATATVRDGRRLADAVRDAARAASAARAGDPTPITAIRYANGSMHTISDYMSMLVRTKTIEVHAQGVAVGMEEAGVVAVEIFDSADCGLTHHDDPQIANGMIVDIATLRAHPSSHPNCVRGWGPRPDLSLADIGTRQPTAPSPANPAQTATRNRFTPPQRPTRPQRASR